MTAPILAFPAVRVLRNEVQREAFSEMYAIAQQQYPEKDPEEQLQLALLGESIQLVMEKCKEDRRRAKEERNAQEPANCIGDRVRTQNGKKRGRKPKGTAK